MNQPVASTAPFSAARRPFPNYDNIVLRPNGSSSVYDAMIGSAADAGRSSVSGRMTWAKSLTDAPGGESGSLIANSYDLQAQRGNVDVLPRHRVIGTAINKKSFATLASWGCG